jgi:hypothetical protein
MEGECYDLFRKEEHGAMSDALREGKRFGAAIGLRDAALALLQKNGRPSQAHGGSIVFELHSPDNPTPRLSLVMLKHPLDGRLMLSVWAMLKGRHDKVLNIEWLGDKVELVSFRRGEWESELLAMARAAGVTVH